MKQAKWLLLLAVGIFVMLPGCNQLGRVPNTDVRTAASITEDIWSGPIWTGGKMPQTQLGDAYIYWQYDYFDENADPGPDGNGQYVNLCLVVKYVTYEPMTDAQLNIDQTEPDGKGAPGLYNFNNYLATELPATTAYFIIPVADLEEISGWDCGEWIWILGHVAAGGETGMIGPNFHHPKGQAWWNDLHIKCDNPGGGGGGDGEYDAETAWGYNIYDEDYWLTNTDCHPPVTKWGGANPYTLGMNEGAGLTVDLWAGAAQNDPDKGMIVGSVTITDDWDGTTCTAIYVTYTLNEGVLLSATHAGANITLQALGDASHGFAPGQLGVTHEFDPWEDGDMITLTYNPTWGNSFVVAAHAVVEIPTE